MKRKRVLGLENEYCLSVILDDGSFVHDTNDLGDWFWDALKSGGEMVGDSSFPVSAFGMVRGGNSRFWLACTGGLLYVDMVLSHPIIEYATPECDAIENAVFAEKGGERILHCMSKFVCESGARYHDRVVKKILFSKSNSDCISGIPLADAHFRGSHDNYQVPFGYMLSDDNLPDPREWSVNFFEKGLASFLPAQVLFSGAGGLVCVNSEWKYYVSPRGSIVSMIIGAAHDYRRPLFNLKREGDTDKKQVRLEIVARDSNMHPKALQWRIGLVSAFLDFIGSRVARKTKLPLLEDPIGAMRTFASDVTLCAKARMRDQRGEWTVVECAQEWLAILHAHAERHNTMTDAERLVVKEARALLEKSKGDPDAFFDSTDWGLKRALLKMYCRKKHLSFSDYKARRFDLYYSDISPDGIFNRWWAEKAKKDPSHFRIPFSEEDMNELIWQNRVAPRAELRKRHLHALHNVSRHTDNNWGVFVLQNNAEVEIRNPMISSHRRVDADIKKLLNKSNKTIKVGVV